MLLRIALLTLQVHHVDQHLFFTAGKGRAIVGGEEQDIEAGDMVIVPQGVKHNCKWYSRWGWGASTIGRPETREQS